MHKSTDPFAHRSRHIPPKKRINRKRRNYSRLIRSLAVSALLLECVWLLFANPYLQVTHVRVTGMQTLSSDQIYAEARVPSHTNLPMLLLRRPFAKRLLADPVIEQTSASLVLPHTLVLHVTERQPYAVLSVAGNLWMLDSHGVPYRQLDTLPPGIPVLDYQADSPPADLVLGKPLQGEWLKEAYKLMALLSDKKNLAVASIKVDQNANLCLNRVDNLQIKLGQPDSLPRKVDMAEATVAAANGYFARRAAYIDVSSPDQPVWMPRTNGQNGKSRNRTLSGLNAGRGATQE